MANSPGKRCPTRRIITGAFHPELENAVIECLSGRASEDPLAETHVVVPTNLLGIRLSRLLAGRIGGHANVRFMTLKDLALEASGNPLPDGRALLPDGAEEIILRGLMEEGLARGGYFEAIADRPGLSRALLGAIRDLKEACYTIDSLAEAGGSAKLLRKGRDCKLTELLRIWRAYETALSDGRWADTQDAMAAAVPALEDTESNHHRPLIVYGFYDLNSLQKRIVAARASAAPETTVFFPFLEVPSFDYARPTLEWFLGLGFDRTDLQVGPARDVPLPADVRIISAPGEAREAREDIRELTSIVESRGEPLQSTAVLARSLEGYSALFNDELANIEARPYLESPPPLSESRSGRSLIRLAEIVTSDFSRVEVTEFLSLADVNAGGGSERPPAADWNRITILAGITSGGDTWEARLAALKTRLKRDGSRFAAAHHHLLDPLEDLLPLIGAIVKPLSDLRPRATIGEFLDALIEVFEAVTRTSDERTLVVSTVSRMRALSSIAGAVPFAYFVELVRARLDQPGAKTERFGSGGPTVLNLMAARGQSFRTVIVPGLVEKSFPAAHRQDPVLLDAERERLNRAVGRDPTSLLPIRGAGVDEERLLFHLAVASARETLVLSFPRLDPSNARPRVPSAFLLRVLGEITGDTYDYEKLEASEHVARVPLSRRFPPDRTRALTREEFDGCSVLAALATGDPAEIAYLVQEDGPLPRRLEMEKVRWDTAAFTEYDAVLTSPEAAEAIAALSGFASGDGGELCVAPTSLEEYARCPFSFYMRHVLGVEPLDEPEEALMLSPLEKGSLYHEALERFMREARASGLLPLSEEAVDALRTVAAGVVGSDKWSLSGVTGARELALSNLWAGLSLWLAGEILEDSPYVPTYFEARFGGKVRPGDDEELSSEEGVSFDAAGDLSVRFSGKIDRIDISESGTGARVIDYKTGRPQTKGRKVLDGGRRLQLPIYLLASSRMLKTTHPDARVNEAEYLYLGGRSGPSRLTLTREELDAATDDLATAVALIVRGVASGMFFSPPDDPGCSSCDYADACGSTATALSRMKKGDPRVEFFTEILSEIK